MTEATGGPWGERHGGFRIFKRARREGITHSVTACALRSEDTMAVTTDKPLGCLNCKTRVKIDTEKCPKCGDRLKPRQPSTISVPVDADATYEIMLDPMIMSTRPQDWAEPARRILQERGAWRNRA
jgi:hypothetical protein